jgi:hypothetical protein
MSAEGIVLKSKKNGYVVAKFHSGGFIKPNHITDTIGANTAGEVVDSMNIVSVAWSASNNAWFRVTRGGNTVLVLGGTGQGEWELQDGRIIDNMGGEPQANVVVTKTGAGPTTLIIKLHKQSTLAGGSIY